MNSHLRTLLPVLLLAATVSHAHLGDIIYPIYELPTADLPDLHDGTLEDWEAVLPNSSLTHNDAVSTDYETGRGVDPADLSFRVFLAWHHASQQIYVAVERLDDVYQPPSNETGGNGWTGVMVMWASCVVFQSSPLPQGGQ